MKIEIEFIYIIIKKVKKDFLNDPVNCTFQKIMFQIKFNVSMLTSTVVPLILHDEIDLANFHFGHTFDLDP